MRRLLVVLLVAAAALVGGRAYAHHSFAATYLEDQTVSIEGELVQFLFRNPHSFVHVMVKEKDGSMMLVPNVGGIVSRIFTNSRSTVSPPHDA